MKNILFSLFIAAVITTASQAKGDDELFVKICAAVLPCDGEGGVLPEFQGGDCFEIYQEQCAELKPEALQQTTHQCHVDRRQVRRLIDRKDREIKRLKSSLKRVAK